MKPYRSYTTTQGRIQRVQRSLWRATGTKDGDFEKPIIAIANSYTQFVPGHVHLRDLGMLVAGEIEKSGGVPKEFHTIAIDDGIAMGHQGMLYSLPSRDLIADSIEYMCNAHCADALVCISNCDKITPGMLLAALRLNIPAVFVSGGPMEAGRVNIDGNDIRISAAEAAVAVANPNLPEEQAKAFERAACPTCGSCAGMFTANSMNCLVEALGLALPGNGTLLATHADRETLFLEAGRLIVDLTKRYYEEEDDSVLPRSIATREAFENAMSIDLAMGGSTNTVLHLLAAAHEAGVDFKMADIDELSRKTPHLCKVSPSSQDYFMEDVHQAGGIMAILGELARGGLIHEDVRTIHSSTLGKAIKRWDIHESSDNEVDTFYRAAAGGNVASGSGPNLAAFSQSARYPDVDLDRESGCIRSIDAAYSIDGGLAVLYGNIARRGCVVKTAAVPDEMHHFKGPAHIVESQEDAVACISGGGLQKGEVLVIRYEGPKGGPGMQEMLWPTGLIKSMGLALDCALITDGRFSGATSGLSIGHISPEAAEYGELALLRDGDAIEIDIVGRTLNVALSDEELALRREEMIKLGDRAWKPDRDRSVSATLAAYAALVTSADTGAIRDPKLVG